MLSHDSTEVMVFLNKGDMFILSYQGVHDINMP